MCTAFFAAREASNAIKRRETESNNNDNNNNNNNNNCNNVFIGRDQGSLSYTLQSFFLGEKEISQKHAVNKTAAYVNLFVVVVIVIHSGNNYYQKV